jgi:hypothetical protein
MVILDIKMKYPGYPVEIKYSTRGKKQAEVDEERYKEIIHLFSVE